VERTCESHGKLRLTFQIGEPEEIAEKIAMMTQIDPVCGMQLNEQETADTSVYEGKTYYFCSRDCKEAFDEEPELYLSGDRRAPWSE
jgi:YHS domain-containing protein